MMIAVPSIDLKQGHVARWESATGFYELRLFRDLFGYPVALRTWGQKDGTRIRTLQTVLETDDRCAPLFRLVIRRMRGRPYTLCKIS